MSRRNLLLVASGIIALFIIVLVLVVMCLKRTDYLIIVPNDLKVSADSLATYRTQAGHAVEVVSLSNVPEGNSPEGIRRWLDAYWSKHAHLKFVVLVGDASILPVHMVPSAHEPTRKLPSDAPYRLRHTVGGQTARLIIGRIPIRSNEEMGTYLEKIRRFEQGVSQRDSVVFFGNQPELNYAQRDSALASGNGLRAVTLEHPSQEQLFKALADTAALLVLYYGHGSPAVNAPLIRTDLGLWKNETAPSIYLSGGCGFGDLGHDWRPLSSELVVRDNGAVATIGANEFGGYGYDYQFVPGFLSAFRRHQTLGEVFDDALRHNEDSMTNASPAPVENDYEEHVTLMGDPALRLR